MTVSDAMKEAWASVTKDKILYETVELDHISFASPIYLINSTETDRVLPLTTGGATATFVACAMNVVLPGETEDGPTQAKLQILTVASFLKGPLRDASRSEGPITVTYRAYISLTSPGPDDYLPGLLLRDVKLTARGAEGTLGYKAIDQQAFPLFTYDETYYPAIHRE